MNFRIQSALALASEDVRSVSSPEPDGVPRRRHIAIGDPQAPFAHFLSILDAHGLLAENGRLVADVHLVSLGDHFDYGPAKEAAQAGEEGLHLLCWLAAHPPDQVTLIAGNHDLARVGELAIVDDAAFAEARAEATPIYEARPDPGREAWFRRRHPDLPGVEQVARDFCTFSVAQRTLLLRLLEAGRFKLAMAYDEHTLLCHAGATLDDLVRASVPASDHDNATVAAAALNAVFAEAFSSWSRSSGLHVAELHTPGSGHSEGGGMLYHRPCHPSCGAEAEFTGPERRRFDPRRLPIRIAQVIGHVADKKCRELLGPWVTGAAAAPGELRHLVTDGKAVRYAAGGLRDVRRVLQNQAAIVFADGGMRVAAAQAYELVDLATLGAVRR